MRQAFLAVVMVVAGVLATDGASAGDGTLTLRGRSLAEARALLFGAPDESPLRHGHEPIKVRFESMKLTAADTPALLALIESATTLPPRSDVRLEGTIDRGRFKAGVEKGKSGRIEVKLEGVTFADEGALVGLVTSLTQLGVKELQMEGQVSARRVELKLKQDPVKAPAQTTSARTEL